jgi:hypothetical protein
MAGVFLIIYSLIDAFWQGIGIAILFLGFVWYSRHQMRKLKDVDQGLSSFDYLLSFHQNLKDILEKNMGMMRLFYPLMFLVGMATVWFAGNNEQVLTAKLLSGYPDMLFVLGIPRSSSQEQQ